MKVCTLPGEDCIAVGHQRGRDDISRFAGAGAAVPPFVFATGKYVLSIWIGFRSPRDIGKKGIQVWG